MGWKESARRSLVGEKVVLQSSGGELWIRPKKLSQEAVDAVREEKARIAATGDTKDLLRRTMHLRKRYPGLLEGVGLEGMPEEDMVEVMALYAALSTGAQRSVYRLELLHGIGEHNLADEAGALVGGGKVLDEKTADEVLEWSDLAAEICRAIEEYNRPLAGRTASTSPTSPSGSTPAPSTGQSPGSSPTGETR